MQLSGQSSSLSLLAAYCPAAHRLYLVFDEYLSFARCLCLSIVSSNRALPVSRPIQVANESSKILFQQICL